MNISNFMNTTNVKKAADEKCDEITVSVVVNNTQVAKVPNGGYCVITIVANSDELV